MNKLYYWLFLWVATPNLGFAQTNYVATSPSSGGPGTYNTLIGIQAGNSISSGNNNVFTGYQAGFSNTTGSFNVYSGLGAGYNNSTGNRNVLIGHQAGVNMASDVVAIGYQAGKNNQGTSNVFVGSSSGFSNTTGDGNSFLGYQVGYNNTTGGGNSFLGYQAGLLNMTGGNNSFFGFQAGLSNTAGSENSFFGFNAGYFNKTGEGNSFVGYNAGIRNLSGALNTFVGYQAGQYNTTGSTNIIIGPNSGTAVTTGNDNVLMGYNVQSGTGTGQHNLILGGEAGGGQWAGNSNTLLGHQTSAESVADLHHATAIGADAKVTMSNAVVLGNQANVGIGTSAPTARLEVVSETPDASGLRLTKLTATSPAVRSSDQFLTVTERGDVVKAHYRLRINTANEWSDNVFTSAYPLRHLSSVAAFISQHGHLPGVPSAQQVVDEGIDLVKMNATLLAKVEELTLYSIQLEKASQQQNDELQMIKQHYDKKLQVMEQKQAQLERLVNQLLPKK